MGDIKLNSQWNKGEGWPEKDKDYVDKQIL